MLILGLLFADVAVAVYFRAGWNFAQEVWVQNDLSEKPGDPVTVGIFCVVLFIAWPLVFALEDQIGSLVG